MYYDKRYNEQREKTKRADAEHIKFLKFLCKELNIVYDNDLDISKRNELFNTSPEKLKTLSNKYEALKMEQNND